MWNNPRQLNIIASAMYAGLIAIMLAGTGLWLQQWPAFALRTLYLTGDIKHINRQIVRQNVLGRLHGNFFTVDLDKMRAAFEQIPWVRQVSVRRVWPNALVAKLEEYQPLGIWGNNQLVSVNGEVFTANQDDVDAKKLPIFSGPMGSEYKVVARYHDFQKWFKAIGAKPKEVILSPRYAWTVRLTNGMQVELGRERNKDTLASRARRLVVAWPMVMQRWGNDIEYVDLRYPNGFALRAKKMRFILDDSKVKKLRP
ncbi:cell division protein FtsQ/DivIB [Candidatus Vallotia cooleyia]|uniref:cell division protein FtsQ/DivIB n=1 Tax=Candidatus Vallotiella adelgis TaxID=1177211 RepID=UPI001D0177B1|nr:cell division protein FtsQ/DivIB [Candidatus Vallotia cooleyia]UDG82220.1 Cell division protein FtsQ [Candidatus Vallotia cooleyia]